MALLNAKCVSPSNAEDLSKVGWSRSSRTDKGVHAARLVVSAKVTVIIRNKITKYSFIC